MKFDAAGTVQWQKFWDNVSGETVTVAPDGSVYTAATAPRPDGGLSRFDVVTVKIAPAGGLQWARTYAAGEVVDARGGIAAAPDSSAIAIAGAIQAEGGGGVVGIAPLLVKIDAVGNLVFDREWGGNKSGGEGSGVAIASNGLIYMSGTITGFGGGFQDAFVIECAGERQGGHRGHVGRSRLRNQRRRGGDGERHRCARRADHGPPPYTLQSAPRKVSGPHGTLSAAAGALIDITGVVTIPTAGTTTTNGQTIYQGNFEVALVRFIP